jgi:Zn-dependent metalloprotease
MKRVCLGLLALVIALLPSTPGVRAQRPAGPVRFEAGSLADLRQLDTFVERLARDGELRLRDARPDTLLAGREHERFDQYYRGVRVYGADVTRQTDRGQTVSVFGVMYDDVGAETTAALSPGEARAIVEELAETELPASYEPELVILPVDGGRFALTYRARAFGVRGPVVYFIDARTGALVRAVSDLQTQAAIGIGTGVLGDRKKLSVTRAGTEYRTDDTLRPPRLVTFDLKGNLVKTIGVLTGLIRLTSSDLAADGDNSWTDPAVVDAHAYVGWVYDFFFKQFGRRGLDNRDKAVVAIVHPVNRDEIGSQTEETVSLFYRNAFYAGDGVMVFGEGMPPSMRDSSGRQWNYLAGALDVIAHELTHGVTDFSSALIYENESGALNEAFSDIMGIAAEFFYQPAGSGSQRADYLLGEDVVTPGGVRSAENPGLFDDPDHYSRRYMGEDDNGGVHINASIGTHAYYLAIEGGTNRTSQRSVTGVGAANRTQIDKVFYRAFTQLMPANSTFATARSATLQAARDLYGGSSGAERALADAWSAVGVE